MKNIKWIKLFNNQLKSLDLNLTDSVLETITCLDIHSEWINYLLNQFTECNFFIKVLSIKQFFFSIFSDNPFHCSCKLFQWITQDFVSKNCHNHLKGQNPKKQINCIGKNNQTKHNILEKDFCPTYFQVSFFSLKKNYKIAKIYNNMLG